MKNKKKNNGRCCKRCFYYDASKVDKEDELPCKINSIPESKTALKNDKEYCDSFIWDDRTTMF